MRAKSSRVTARCLEESTDKSLANLEGHEKSEDEVDGSREAFVVFAHRAPAISFIIGT